LEAKHGRRRQEAAGADRRERRAVAPQPLDWRAAVALFERKTKAHLTVIERSSTGWGELDRGVRQDACRTCTLGLTIGIGTLLALTKRGLEFAGSLGEVSRQLGVTSKDLQVYRFADVAGRDRSGRHGPGPRQADEVDRPGGDRWQAAAEGVQGFGISIRDANGEVKTAGDVIPEIAAALTKVHSPPSGAAVLLQLFGKSGQKNGHVAR